MCRPPKPDADAVAAHWARRTLAVGLLRSISGMVLTPVVPGILKSALGGDQKSVAAYQADWIFYGAFVQLMIGPVCGALGDRVGRKPILVACALCNVLGACAVLFAHLAVIGPVQFWCCWLLRQVATVAAMTTTSASISDAYAHDRTKIAKTAARLGGMQMGLGMLLGPALGALIASQYGPRGTSFVAIGGGVLALIGQVFLVPEASSGPPSKKHDLKNPFAAPFRLFSEGAPLRFLALASLSAALCRGESAVYSPFMVDVWKAGPSGLALTMTVVGATFAASQALLVGPLVKNFGAVQALRLGYMCSTLQRVVWSSYTHPGVMAFGLALGSPGFGADAILQQLALEYHPSAAPPRGELAASFGALGTLSVLASSKAFGRLFAWGAPRGWPGAPFAVGAAASLAAFAFASLASNAADKRAKAD
jgi:DHA1 family tetracycline resistance protein-like MFS transporter